MAKVVLLGASSIAGWNLYCLYRDDLEAFCPSFTHHANAKGMNAIRLESPYEVEKMVERFEPEAIIHCGGICDVEKCQENPEFALQVNVESVRILLNSIGENTRLVYVSNDHVFGEDGAYDEASAPAPISFYGECRVQAEELVQTHENHLVIRHGLPLGSSLTGRNGHLDWLNYRMKNGLPVTIVKDEARSVVHAESLAKRIWDLAHSEVRGIRHIQSKDFMGRPRLAKALQKKLHLPGELIFETRSERSAPNLGRVELRTQYKDKYSSPLSPWTSP